MKVMIIFGAYPPDKDGGGYFVKQLANEFVDCGNYVSILTSVLKGESPITFKDNGTVVHRIVKSWGFTSFFSGQFNFMINTVRKFGPDLLVLIYPYKSNCVSPYLLKLFLPKINLVTILFQSIKLFPITIYDIFHIVGAPLLYLRSDFLFFQSHFLFKAFIKMFPFFRKKSQFLPSPAVVNLPSKGYCVDNLTKHRSFVKLSPDLRYVGFFGFWSKRKGIDILIKAFAKVRKIDSSVRLLLIGGYKETKYTKSLFDCINSLDIVNDVVVTGYLEENKIINYLLSLDAYVLPLRCRFVTPSTLSLGIALRLPIITSHEFGLLQNETNALVVPSNHIEALASAIRRLVQNDELKRRFSKNLSDIAREIEWKHIARKIMDVSHP